jgi:hypothetical protein
VEADSFPRLHFQTRPVVGRPEKHLVGSLSPEFPQVILEASRGKEHFPDLRVCSLYSGHNRSCNQGKEAGK